LLPRPLRLRCPCGPPVGSRGSSCLRAGHHSALFRGSSVHCRSTRRAYATTSPNLASFLFSPMHFSPLPPLPAGVLPERNALLVRPVGPPCPRCAHTAKLRPGSLCLAEQP